MFHNTRIDIDVRVRHLTIADLEDIAVLNRDSVQAAAERLDPLYGFLDEISIEDVRSSWLRAFGENSFEIGSGETLIGSFDEGRLAGFVWYGPKNENAGIGELKNLFIAPSHWRRGLGRFLFNTAVEDLIAEGYTAMDIQTEEDVHARNFYESMGCRPIIHQGQHFFGEYRYYLGGEPT